jgi:hypothetical protein
MLKLLNIYYLLKYQNLGFIFIFKNINLIFIKKKKIIFSRHSFGYESWILFG